MGVGCLIINTVVVGRTVECFLLACACVLFDPQIKWTSNLSPVPVALAFIITTWQAYGGPTTQQVCVPFSRIKHTLSSVFSWHIFRRIAENMAWKGPSRRTVVRDFHNASFAFVCMSSAQLPCVGGSSSMPVWLRIFSDSRRLPIWTTRSSAHPAQLRQSHPFLLLQLRLPQLNL